MRLATFLTLSALAFSSAVAQQPLVGYTASSSARERALESDAIARPSPDSAAVFSKVLSKETHVAGTPVQARTRDYVLSLMKRWGLDVESREYDVWMPHPTAVHVARVSPQPRELSLAEPPVPGDPTSALAQYPTVNGYSGQGDATGELVYVNYGLIEDYAKLDSMGISVRGKIAIARYGRSYRGIKAREAEKHGASALLIYSDPQDDGYVVGDVYPDGPMRNSAGVQRGSVLNVDGDPSTPGYASVPGATRLSPEQMDIPHIPVVPISYGNASELLRFLRGVSAPRGWQGGLAFHYHVGPGPVKARVAVADDRATKPIKPIFDTFGMIRGSEYPDQLVIIGGHRDAWGPGTADNVSGSVSVLEAARAVAAAVKAGARPKRTIVFATWDAEEWGLLGSTEFVEQDSQPLAHAVAYFNQDVAAQGPAFDAGGSPSLRATLRDITRAVPLPDGSSTVYADWRRRSVVPDSVEPAMGDPGGGSDFAGFYNHLGIPILEWGFGGPGGVYHSQYDDYAWMSRFGDPGFKYHATAARIAAATVLRLANADILPYDYAEFGRTMAGYVDPLERQAAARHWELPTATLRASIQHLQTEGALFDAARDSALAAHVGDAQLARANDALMRVERALTRPEGLRTRPWFRNLIYVADENNGYANMVLPSINEALRSGDQSLTRREIDDLSSRFDRAAEFVAQARAALQRQ